MVHPFLVGSTLLRTQRTILPRTYCRYKSITAAIERGRQGGPNRFSSPRAPPSYGDDAAGPGKTRFEKRLERFGPPRDDAPPSRQDNGVRTPRSSRFGRVGPSRPRDDAPSRFREERPRHGLDEERSRGRRAFDSNSRFDRRDTLARPVKTFGERSRDPFDERQERRPRQEGYSGSRDAGSYDTSKRFDRSDKFSKFDRPKTPYSDRAASKPWNRSDARPQRSDRFAREEEGSSYMPRTRDTRDGRPRESRFSHGDSKGPQRERFGRAPYEPAAPVRAGAEVRNDSARGPESLPFTTAASEFIYGYSSVLAAIKANRRKFYNIYVHSRGASRDGLMARIRAQKLFPLTQEVGDEYMRALDKASSGRPHNGVILESSPLPVPPITELKTVTKEDESFSVGLDSQSAEDLLVNGKQELYSYKSAGWRHPLILYVDGVVDEGNLGAIARSAYFLGVDAVITPTHHTANWSHIALKASAGAAEAIPLFKVGEPNEFLGKSSRAGWRIYASDAVPPAPSTTTSSPEIDAGTSKVVYTFSRSTKRLPTSHSPVAEHPTILMMGAESTGLKTSLLNLAHYKVGIPHGRDVDEVGVDSLNVSVAASLLCYEMLQKPKSQAVRNPDEVLF